MVPTLQIGAAISVVAAAIYGIVGRAVQRRAVSESNRRANQMFALWWYTLGGTTLAGALLGLTFTAGYQDLSLFVTFTYVSLALIVIALFGLVYYLLFLTTGKRWIMTPLAVFYAAYGVLLLYFVQSGKPDGLVSTGWSVTLHYATPPGPVLTGIVVALLILPEVLGAATLFGLVFVVKQREQKFRLVVVSLSIFLWFSTSYAGSLAGLGTNLTWQLVTRLIGVAAALAILIAYRPPEWVRNRIAGGHAEPAPEPVTRDPSNRMASTSRQLAG